MTKIMLYSCMEFLLSSIKYLFKQRIYFVNPVYFKRPFFSSFQLLLRDKLFHRSCFSLAKNALTKSWGYRSREVLSELIWSEDIVQEIYFN